MGNKHTSPFPSYDNACTYFNTEEIAHFNITFRSICLQKEYLDINTLTLLNSEKLSSYTLKHLLSKLFAIVDSKKDALIDFEEYLCALALFRFGTVDEKMKLLFILYEPTQKGINGYIPRDVLCKLLRDSLQPAESNGESSKYYEEWSRNLVELIEGMADMVLVQVNFNL
jgi:Ca2+-binding EF-hand superfamily protein